MGRRMPERPVGINLGLQWLDALDDVRRLLRQHDGGCVQISADDARHYRRVDHPQPIETMNPGIGGDHRLLVVTHLAGTGWMVGALALGSYERVDVGITLNGGPRGELRAAERRKRLLREDLAGQAHRIAHLLAIAPGAHVVEQDRGAPGGDPPSASAPALSR